uniref:Uncharacterized protein n=1 Tax=Branchiostoma floridae TaxID=7739 RepID=C4A0C5_BRAFL|eukprot:XP_002585741.1 hypothetical protein BRAFLDRAFT_111267 [Branchiostoma floridae]
MQVGEDVESIELISKLVTATIGLVTSTDSTIRLEKSLEEDIGIDGGELSRSENNESMEDSMEESSTLKDMEVDEHQVPRTYEVVEGARKKYIHHLIDNLGYRFGTQRRLPSVVHRTCTVPPEVQLL